MCSCSLSVYFPNLEECVKNTFNYFNNKKTNNNDTVSQQRSDEHIKRKTVFKVSWKM